MASEVRYLVFDVESVVDGDLVSAIRYPDESLSAAEATAKYRAELLEKTGGDFVPYTFQLPLVVAAAKVAADYSLLDLAVLDEEQLRPHVVTERFWRGWEVFGRPTLVTFNGRTFDLPLLELAAFRYGVGVPAWYAETARSFEQPRNRFNQAAHFDLQELLTNFGATRVTGGLNLVAALLGKPGKMDVQGCMVQDLYEAGRLAEIADYCRCDVLDTYFVFLRGCVLLGRITLDREQELIAATRTWLESEADSRPAYRQYLDRWGDWRNPWTESDG